MAVSVRVVAVAAAACLAAGVIAVRSPSATGPGVRLRSLSATEVTAVPARPNAGRTERVVIVGDSVGTATACSCRAFGVRLAQLLARQQSETVRVATVARDGQTTAGLVEQLTSDAGTSAQVRAADAVVVVIGANDFDADDAASGCAGAGTSCFSDALAALPTSLDRALSQIRVLGGAKARILVLGYWNVFLDGDVGSHHGPTYQQTSDALTRKVDDVLHRSALRAAATYVDLYRAFRDDGTRDDTALLASDGDHPSAAGHQRIAALLAGYLTDRPRNEAGG